MNPAFLIIDMQVSQLYALERRKRDFLSRHVYGMRDAFASLGTPVIHVGLFKSLYQEEWDAIEGKKVGKLDELPKVLRKGLGPTSPSNICYSPSFFRPVPSEDYVAAKRTASACTPEMKAFLREREVDTVVMAGLWEGEPGDDDIDDACVTSSAIDFAKEGFSSIIVTEGTNIFVGQNFYPQQERIIKNGIYGVNVLPVKEVARKISGQNRKFFFWKNALASCAAV